MKRGLIALLCLLMLMTALCSGCKSKKETANTSNRNSKLVEVDGETYLVIDGKIYKYSGQTLTQDQFGAWDD